MFKKTLVVAFELDLECDQWSQSTRGNELVQGDVTRDGVEGDACFEVQN